MDRLWTPWRYEYLANADVTRRDGVPAALAAWPGDLGCVFCNLLAATQYAVEHGMAAEEADRAAGIVFRSQHTFVCLNSFPYTSGHIMILPYRHESSLAELEAGVAQEVMTLAQRAEIILREVYSPGGLNMGLNLGQAAGAGVAGHLHLHVLPRWVGDSNFMTVIGETRVIPETLETTWKRLRPAFLAHS
jgi:ATP adenylyltransferase